LSSSLIRYSRLRFGFVTVTSEEIENLVQLTVHSHDPVTEDRVDLFLRTRRTASPPYTRMIGREATRCKIP
jgi:hypothetical protein